MIRKVKVEDLDDIVSIEKESFSTNIMEKREVYEERIDTFPQGAMIIEEKQEIIGFITSEIWRKDKIKPSDFELGHSIREIHNEKGRTIYISSFALSKKHRGRGMGNLFFKKYIEYILGKFQKLNQVILIVSEKWKKARKIYEKYGFKNYFLVDDFFGENISGIVMIYKVEGR